METRRLCPKCGNDFGRHDSYKFCPECGERAPEVYVDYIGCIIVRGRGKDKTNAWLDAVISANNTAESDERLEDLLPASDVIGFLKVPITVVDVEANAQYGKFATSVDKAWRDEYMSYVMAEFFKHYGSILCDAWEQMYADRARQAFKQTTR